MERVRPSTAEIAAAIDGFYDDFEERQENDDALGEESDNEASLLAEEAVDKKTTLEDVHRELCLENEILCRRAKIVLQQRAQGRQKPVVDPSKLSETETRFRAALKQWPQILQEQENNANRYREKTDRVQKTCDEKAERIAQLRQTFTRFCVDITTQLLKNNSAAVQEVAKLLEAEKSVAQEMHSKRLESVGFDSQVRRLEKKMADRDRLGDGLHLMDFEQLKIENQTLKEKIDERNQELIQLKKKTSSVVQVLTHVCEKLHFVEDRIEARRLTIDDDAIAIAEHKRRLQQTKRDCLSLHRKTESLHRRCFRVTQESLLEDILQLKETKVTLGRQLERLRQQYTSVHG